MPFLSYYASWKVLAQLKKFFKELIALVLLLLEEHSVGSINQGNKTEKGGGQNLKSGNNI